MNRFVRTFLVLLLTLSAAAPAFAQRGPGRGQGRGGPGNRQDERFTADRDTFHFLLANHQQIRRTVKPLNNGVETLTESADVTIAARIKEHVRWMEYRIEKNNPIRRRDPLFAEIFKHAEKIKIVRTETDQGVKVTETSDDPYVAKLIQAHAKAVSGFVARGFAEATKNHPVPNSTSKAEDSIPVRSAVDSKPTSEPEQSNTADSEHAQ